MTNLHTFSVPEIPQLRQKRKKKKEIRCCFYLKKIQQHLTALCAKERTKTAKDTVLALITPLLLCALYLPSFRFPCSSFIPGATSLLEVRDRFDFIAPRLSDITQPALLKGV